MSKLVDPWFDATFYDKVTAKSHRMHVPFPQSQGLFLWCPCGYGALDANGQELYPLDFSLNLGRPHGLLVPFANPPSGIPLPPDHGPLSRDGLHHPRWTVVSGSGLADLTLSPSIAVGDPECWHGYITAGEVLK